MEQKNENAMLGQKLKHHAIQLVALQTTELSVKVKGEPSSLRLFQGSAQLESAHSPYDEAEKTIHVRLRGVIPESADMPLSLYAELVGVFKVDESQFNKIHIIDWAEKNAPIVLYPYIRELVFSLVLRIGAPGLIMPLLEVPSFKVVAPS